MTSNQNVKIDPLDPRSRLHFVKYVTKDDDTSKFWECGICGKEFKHQYTLVRHLPVHTDERNFQCNECEKAFRQLSTLTQHKASKHSNSKPYVCEICTKSFNRVSILINHKKTHTTEKHYKCEICEKAFHQKTNLKMHMNIHTNKRPYSCYNCKKGFNQKSNLAVHQKSCCKKVPSVEQPKTHDWTMFPSNSITMSDNTEMKLEDNVNHNKDSTSEESNVNPDYILEELEQEVEPGSPHNRVTTYLGSKTGEAVLGDESALVISPICTPEYTSAVSRGQRPFVLFQPCKGPPVIVKVRSIPGDKHLLVPTNVKDFQEKQDLTKMDNLSRGLVSHVQVPIVALVQQNVDAGGQIRISVASPSGSNGHMDGFSRDKMEQNQGQIIEEQHVIFVDESGEIMDVKQIP